MPKEYIEREATLEVLRNLGNRDYRREKGTIADAIKMIMHPAYTPTADVVEVRHGKWERVNPQSDVHFYCSECHTEISTSWEYDEAEMFSYCPRCGAKMDGKGSEVQGE